MSLLASARALIERVVRFVIEHAGPVRTFAERAIEAVKGLLRLDWRGEPVASAAIVAVAALQALPSLSDVALSIPERAVAAVVVFATAVAASTKTRAKSVLPKKYAGS